MTRVAYLPVLLILLLLGACSKPVENAQTEPSQAAPETYKVPLASTPTKPAEGTKLKLLLRMGSWSASCGL